MDYVVRPFSLTFTSGVTAIPLKVEIIDDDIFEGDEHFFLTIDSSALPNNVITGDHNEFIVILSDFQDGKWCPIGASVHI